MSSVCCLFSVFPATALPLIKETDVVLTGNMSRQGRETTAHWFDEKLKDQPSFTSAGQPTVASGTFTSGVFRAPAELEFYLSGYPTHKGNRIYLRDDQVPSRTLGLVSTEIDPGLFWRLRVWDIPAAWQNVPVRLIVEDASPGTNSDWVALTLPAPAHSGFFYKLTRAAWRATLSSFAALGFLLPGLAVAFIVHRRVPLEAPRMVIVTLVAAGILGYIVFWAYFATDNIGKDVSILIEVSAICICAFHVWRGYRSGERRLPREMAIVFASTLLVAVFYSSLAFVYLTDSIAGEAIQRRFFTFTLPPDNVLPEIVADRLYANQSLHPPLVAEWQTSDRPPLQAGLVLTQYPMWPVIRPELVYDLVSTFLQCTWLAAVWVLLRNAGLSYRRIVPAMALCVLSGFCFVNSVYVWPKLLAAAFCIMGLSLFVTPTGFNVKLSRPEWGLAGLCFGLSLLSHSGSAFTILGIAIVILFHWKNLIWRNMIPGALCLILLLMPWVMFQKLYDPPGDQLIKLSLTGATNHDLTLTQALGKAYHGMTAGEFLHRRWEDVKILFYTDDNPIRIGESTPELLNAFVNAQFFCFFFALEFVNLGFLSRLIRGRRSDPGSFLLPDKLVTIVLIALPVWILLMSEARSTLIHAGSLANLLLMFVAGGLYLATIFPRGVYAVIAIQAVVFLPLTVFSLPALMPEGNTVLDIVLDTGMLSTALLALATLAFISWMAVNRSEAPMEVTN